MFNMRSAVGAVLWCAMAMMAGCAMQSQIGGMQIDRGNDVYMVGHVTGVTVDGDASDWRDRGLHVTMLTPLGSEAASPTDFDARFRLGWDERGLLVLAEVKDDKHVEAESEPDIWQADAIELFVADERGGSQRAQVLIAPGLDEKHPQLRLCVKDQRTNAQLKRIAWDVQVARRATAGGYTAEVLVPWKAMGIEPAVGRRIGVQIYFNDEDSAGGPRKQLIWYPQDNTYTDSTKMNEVVLDEKSGPAVVARATASYERLRRVRVDVAADASLAGQDVVLIGDVKTKTRQTLREENGCARATLRQGLEEGLPDGVMLTDGRMITRVILPDLAKAKAEALLNTELRFTPSTVFHGEALPTCDFAQPGLMEDVIGPYRIDVVYYDAAHQPVKTAEKPGRYGAVVKIVSADGRERVRYRTLYRMAKDADVWDMAMKGKVELPAEYGISPEIVEQANEQVMDQLKWSFAGQAETMSWNALLLAGMSEMKPGEPGTAYSNSWSRDRQWWVEQKRLTNGNAERFTTKLDRPMKQDAIAPMLHDGTMADAGMTDDAPAKIDAVLQQWAADSDQAFAVCVVRNGVVVLHKAYGVRDGKPMTTDTKSWMASLSKLVSGTCLMMAVDQGLMELDAPVDRYSPLLKGAKFNRTPTIRNLYTHTAGLTSHRGEDDHELEELVAELAPTLKVADHFEYDGMGLELGMKLLEQVSGESYPQYVKKHLLDPLGCTNTDALNASWNTKSTAMDMAKIGQMLLNGGAYGSWRFMSEQTRDAAMPVDISTLIGRPSDVKYGIGTQWFSEPGLSDRCYAHGAASAATLRIDPKNKLVISMTRNGAGQNFSKYHPLFIKTVTDCMTGSNAVTGAAADPAGTVAH